MEQKLTKLQRLGCWLIGWNPEILANCRESSFRSMKKYISAMIILAFIWGVIGFCFAERYIGIESWYGQSIVAAVFIIIIFCIERFIILNDGGKSVFVFRIVLALLMSGLGSTIFDQLIFKRDVDVIMKEVRTEQINIEVPKRMMIIDAEIKATSMQLDSIGLEINKVNEKITRTPPTTNSTTIGSTTERDSTGKIVVTGRNVTKTEIINPVFEQFAKEREMLSKEIDKLTEKKEKLFEKKLSIEKEVRNEFENMEPGFLEELKALFILLRRENVALIFYIALFAFLTSIELLVLLSKWGEKKCDYELTVESQRNIREEKLKNSEKAILRNDSK